MKHLGDITLIHGNEIEPVDCIIGGSPCQDLSVAGKRAGLSGERSGLFVEQIRIVKEMRKRYEKPRYMVWENVPGAFSSNNGEDFRAVLEEITKIADETAVIPRPPKGKWSYAGCVMGDGWSVAWRTHDAQFWGVPQRRRRIALVADFGGESAPEILFEREGLQRDFAESGTLRKTVAGDAANRTGDNDRAGEGFDGYNGDLTGDVSATLGVNCGVSTGRNGVIECRGDERLCTVTDVGMFTSAKGKATSLLARQYKDLPVVSYNNYIARRLTPLECERLQGFPDGWTDIGDWIDTKGKKHKSADAPRYKALGNSIALPFWDWMLHRMAGYLPTGATMGSLFDGIGGFPLCWETIHGKGSTRWASEIEEFPIAVTKMRFPEEATK